MTVETEANGDLWRTIERGPSLVGSLLVVPVQEICILPCLFWTAQNKKKFLASQYFNLRVPIAKQPGQEVVQGRLSLSVYLLCAKNS
jgi:hypothetical protein